MFYIRKNFETLVKKFKSRNEFSNYTNISINTIKATLDKGTTPGIETLIKLNQIFKISLDDLVFKDLSEGDNS